jgi:hypothetical protein
MNEKSRRNILKGLAVGTPMVWAKPVVESVMLPAHAESTINPAPPPTPCDFSGCFAETDIAGNSYRIAEGELIHYIGTETCSGGDSQHSDGPVSTAATAELAAEELACDESSVRALSSHSTYDGACPVWSCD